MKFVMTGQENGDFLIQVTTSQGCIAYCLVDIEKIHGNVIAIYNCEKIEGK
jgi:hypothetical protein